MSRFLIAFSNTSKEVTPSFKISTRIKFAYALYGLKFGFFLSSSNMYVRSEQISSRVFL